MFTKYKTINYPIEINGKTVYKTVRDITTNIRPKPSIMNDYVNFEPRTLIDGETFEITANEEYSNPKYHYLVMLANDSYDWREDRPLTQYELDQTINEKYTDPNAVHHYIDIDGNVIENIFDDGSDIGQCYPKNVIPVTNREYEQEKNDNNRYIRIITPKYVSTAVSIIEDTLKESNNE